MEDKTSNGNVKTVVYVWIRSKGLKEPNIYKLINQKKQIENSKMLNLNGWNSMIGLSE